MTHRELLGVLLWVGLIAAAWIYGVWCGGDEQLARLRREYQAEKAAERDRIRRARAASRRVIP